MRDLAVHTFLLFSLAVAVTLVPGTVTMAGAADCGDGAGACSCGDRVVADTTLDGGDPVTTTTCACTGLIVANGVSLDLGGRTIRGSDACVGILVESGANDVTVTRGRIFHFQTGLATEGTTDDGRVTNLEIAFNTAGVDINGSRNTLERNAVHENLRTCVTVEGDDNVIRSNNADACGPQFGDAIAVAGIGNTVARNVIRNTGGNGIAVSGARSIIDRNRSITNFLSGIKVEGSEHQVTSNITELSGRANSLPGILIDATLSRFSRNRSDQNFGFGMQELTPGGNIYELNICNANALGDSDPPGLCR